MNHYHKSTHNKKQIFTTILFVFLFFGQIFSQKETGLPYIKNFLYNDYIAHQQNFSIAQDAIGIMYFVNFSGILTYDGVRWHLSTSNLKSRVEKIHFTDSIICTNQKEIGILHKYKNNLSIDRLISSPEVNLGNGIFEKKIFFANSKAIYTIENNKPILYAKLNFSESIKQILPMGNNFLIQTISGKFYTLNKKQKKEIFVSSLNTQNINVIKTLKLKSKWILITDGSGILVYDGTKIQAHNKLSPYPFEALVSDAIVTTRQELILATDREGIFRYDADGNMIEKISEESGIFSNSVNAIFQDSSEKIWLATNNGISLIDIYFPLRFLNEKSGLLGEIYGSKILNSKHYFYGNRGLFYLAGNKAEQVPFIKQSCWDIDGFGSELFFATNKGVFTEINGQVQQISENLSLALYYSKANELLYVGTSEGISIFKKKSNRFIPEFTIKTTTNVLNLQRTDDGLWIDFGTSKLGLLKDKATEIEYFDEKSGLPELISYRINVLKNKVLVSAKGAVYSFDRAKNKFRKNDSLSINAQIHNGIYKLFPGLNDKLWYTDWSENGLYELNHKKNKLEVIKSKFNLFFSDLLIWNIENLPDSSIWVSSPNGIVVMKNQKIKKYTQFKTFFRRIEYGLDSVLIDHNTEILSEKYFFPFQNNDIKFYFGSNNFQVKGALEFSYLLEGGSGTWSNWSPNPFHEFVGLQPGDYKLKIKARDIFENEADISSFSFQIVSPLSQRWYAYLFYLALLAALIYALVRWRINSLHKEKLLLEEIIADRTDEISQQKNELETKSQLIFEKNNELGRINSIVQAINNEIDFTNLLTSILASLKIVKGMDSALTLRLLPQNSDSFEIAAVYQINFSLENDFFLTKNEIESVFIHNSQEVFDGIFYLQTYSETDKWPSKIWNRIRSAVTIEIAMEEKIKGYLILVNFDEARAFDHKDLSLLLNLKEHLVSAFIKTNLLSNLTESNSVLSERNSLISKQQEDIHASIRYASRIQKAMLPSREMLAGTFPNHFVLFKPRDVVSGDFFWMQTIGNKQFIAAADCTGHGIPGAFVSMLAISLLNEIASSLDFSSPSEILEILREKIKHSLGQNNANSEQKDGLDISLCAIDFQTHTLEYAGAYNSLFLVRNGELIEYKATRNPIAVFIKEIPFENNEISLEKGDILYLFSDGYADQFGHVDGRKLFAKRFKDLLLSTSQLPINEQATHLDTFFENWRGRLQQLDDVLVLGILI